MTTLDTEDAKLVTLARGAMARASAAGGAAVRDTDGRTYAGATVSVPGLELTALQVAIATALSSGAEGVEAAVVVVGADDDPGRTALAQVSGAPYLVFTDRAGEVQKLVEANNV